MDANRRSRRFMSEPSLQLRKRYSIAEELSSDGLGCTWLAVDQEASETRCVITQIQPPTDSLSELQNIRELFFSEADYRYELNAHPYIPKLLNSFEENSAFYLIREYVEGHALMRELSDSIPWSNEEVIVLLSDMLDTLLFAHQRGVGHQDLRPENLIRNATDRRLALINFGRLKQRCDRLLVPYPSVDSPPLLPHTSYMPDEQIAGYTQLNSDIYAVGIIAIQALTGLQPGELFTGIRKRQAVWHPHASLRHPALVAFLDKMTRPDYRERFPTASEAWEDLHNLPPELAQFIPLLSSERAIATPQDPTAEVLPAPSFTRLPGHTAPSSHQSNSRDNSARADFESEEIDPVEVAQKRALPIAVALIALIGGTIALIRRAARPVFVAKQNNAISRTLPPENDIRNAAPNSVTDDSVTNDSAAGDGVDNRGALNGTVPNNEILGDQVPENTPPAASEPAFVPPSRSLVPSPDAEVSAESRSFATPVSPSMSSPPAERQAASEADPELEQPAVVTNLPADLNPESAKQLVLSFYEAVADRSWERVRALLNDKLSRSLEPRFFEQFYSVSVENMRVVNQTPDSIDLMVQNTYVYRDGSVQQEERSYTVALVSDRPTIVETAFEAVIRDRSY